MLYLTTKVGGSPPKVLARVLACCGRFWQLLDHEGGEDDDEAAEGGRGGQIQSCG